ncbi:hypothetical protein CXB51_014483 [Gossypium anomalum]|uniref:PABS domain-containing protein n=1 Tax=Gossypium anomalum TaxID=47600 RepID=A0A8J5Z0A1_9ROSI|nr:hypothetical protein CXB51_014483 [Gossypium anomalum]
MGEAVEIFYPNGFSKICNGTTKNQPPVDETRQFDSWYEEEIDEDLKWSFALKSVLYKGSSEYQDIALLDTKRFGKVLVIDGKMQSAEPKTVFIMGGGEGSAAREALRHKFIDEVVMCDIDEEVVNFCRRYLTVNRDAFAAKSLTLLSMMPSKAELEKRTEKFDIIVGDLADPVEGGPCYQLYTKSFYEKILKPKLNENGILSLRLAQLEYSLTRRSFPLYTTNQADVLAYTAHVPSFADTWGWRIAERVDGELLYLNGSSFLSSATMNKTVYLSLLNETHVYTEENARFIPGHGLGNHL